MQPPAMEAVDVNRAMAACAPFQVRCPQHTRVLYAADTLPTGPDGETLNDPASAVWEAAGCLADPRSCPCATEPDAPVVDTSPTAGRSLPEGVTLIDIGPTPPTPPAPPAPTAGTVPTLAALPTLAEMETPEAPHTPVSTGRVVTPLSGMSPDQLRAAMTLFAAEPPSEDPRTEP